MSRVLDELELLLAQEEAGLCVHPFYIKFVVEGEGIENANDRYVVYILVNDDALAFRRGPYLKEFGNSVTLEGAISIVYDEVTRRML